MIIIRKTIDVLNSKTDISSYQTKINPFIKHRRYAQYTEGIETEAKTKQLEQLIIEE